MEVIRQTPVVHEANSCDSFAFNDSVIEMSFYVKFNNMPIRNNQFHVILNWVQSARDQFQRQVSFLVDGWDVILPVHL